jgi:phosphoribosylamine--glycine ligase
MAGGRRCSATGPVASPVPRLLTAAPACPSLAAAQVFHAGTSRNEQGEVVASGGRVLNITALGPDVASAQAAAYQGVAAVQWDDAYYRKDIGWRAVAREKAGKGQ